MKTSEMMQLSTAKESLELSYFESVALGLLALAMKFEFFKKQLMQHLFDHDFILPAGFEMPEVSLDYRHIKWIPSIHPNVAEDKLIWLLNEIEQAPEMERQRVIKILSFAYKKMMPEMAAWGILFGETLFVAVGNPDVTSAEYSQVIVLDPSWKELDSQNLVKKVNEVSLAMLTRCIEEANFNIKRLEPEVSSWLLKGSGLKLYSAKTNQDFKDILTNLNDCGMPFVYNSENNIGVIALQPSITGSYDILLAKLTPL